QEMKNGRKQSHWMWYIFPQLRGLGRSDFSDYYGIADLIEAEKYLKNPTLHIRLEEITNVLLRLNENDALLIIGDPDHHKLKSSMTLFSTVPNSSAVFEKVLEKVFQGKKCKRTVEMLEKNKSKSLKIERTKIKNMI